MMSYAILASVFILLVVVVWLAVSNQIAINDARKHSKRNLDLDDENSYS